MLTRKQAKARRLRVGDRVKSHYKAAWEGVVLEVTPRKGTSDLVRVQPDIDRHGNPITGHCPAVWTDAGYLSRAEPASDDGRG